MSSRMGELRAGSISLRPGHAGVKQVIDEYYWAK